MKKIVTSQPKDYSIIQDGDFNSVEDLQLVVENIQVMQHLQIYRKSGYYKLHDIVVGLKTGSMSDFQFKDGSDGKQDFIYIQVDLPTDITNSQPTGFSNEFIK